MASLEVAMELLSKYEYSDNPAKFFHKNKGEHNYTVGGIYRYANKDALDYAFIDKILSACGGDYKRASRMLFADKQLKKDIFNWTKREVWDKMKLDQVNSQEIANELFMFGFNSYWKTAAKVAQRIIGVKPDGYIGKISLEALNKFDENKFDIVYDEREEEYYNMIIERNPELQRNRKGWLNRAYSV